MKNNRDQVIIRTSFIGIAANVLLVGFKAFIGFLAGSISIIMDALNNLTDVLSSVITIIGTKIANKKPDREHPFGHGRAEYIASTFIAALILFAGGLAIYESIMSVIDYFNNKTLPGFTLWSLIIIGVAILVKVGVGIFYKIQGKKVKSASLVASGTDALFDAILSTATLVGAIFAYTLHWYVEGYLGILIGLFIIKSGISILRESISSILGERYDAEETKAIVQDILSVPGVEGAYDLILNSYGHKKSIGSVHVAVDNKKTAEEIQTIERNVSALMYQKYNIIMTVGIYVNSVNTELSKAIYNYLSSLTKEYKYILQLHGFYVDEEKHVCLFDIVLSFDEENPEGTAKEIETKMNNQFPKFTFYVNIDRDFSLS